MSMIVDPRFRRPRIWSNLEIAKIAKNLRGDVVNVSGWRDEDKQGSTYRDHYFVNASQYWITNWNSDARGFQGDLRNEIFLDLESELESELVGRFDVVFNHTTLEHVFDVFQAFRNLCLMSRDAVVVVVPFLQEQHGEYGDYWRFTPWAIKRLFERNGVTPAYISYNDSKNSSIYIVGAGARQRETCAVLRNIDGNRISHVEDIGLGAGLILSANPVIKLAQCLKKFLGKV